MQNRPYGPRQVRGGAANDVGYLLARAAAARSDRTVSLEKRATRGGSHTGEMRLGTALNA